MNSYQKAEAAFLSELTELSRKHGLILVSHDPFWVETETVMVADPAKGAERVSISKGGRCVVKRIGEWIEALEWQQEASSPPVQEQISFGGEDD